MLVDIVACPNYLTWGVSFDDGPSLNSMFHDLYFFLLLSDFIPSLSPVSVIFLGEVDCH